uniref:Olfactory receptor n=1 Tax=Bombyx mori TaxID=7091 RepID=B1B1Q1_BOMMO|nr:olfactory receptor-like receptor [Bombyx mori]BAH66332.1 olfactory receptor [Bombyx mori]
MVVLSLGISSEIGTLKFFYTFIYIKKVQRIVREYLECDHMVVPGSRFADNVLKTMRNVKKRAILYWVVVIGNGVVYVTKPLFMSGRHHMEDRYIVYGLEPMFESPNYEVAYFLMMFGLCFICYPPANVTVFLIVVVGYTEAQMIALGEEMLRIWEDAVAHYNNKYHTVGALTNSSEKNKIINQYVKFRLTEIIKMHTTNIQLLRQVEFVFRSAIAMGYVFLVLGLIAELLGGLENTYLQIPFALIQVLVDCYTGQKVMDASSLFEQAVYDCKWENFDKSNMKTVLLILQNSQKSMRLSVGGITVLGFSCMMSVMKSIYSAYATLRTTMS